jgi:hypothetical protein
MQKTDHTFFLPTSLTFAHRALAAAAIFASQTALIFRRFFGTGASFAPFNFAHRLLCAAAIAILAALDRL